MTFNVELTETYHKRNIAEILDLSLLNRELQVGKLEEKVDALPPEVQYTLHSRDRIHRIFHLEIGP
jgi:hypothetical protein